MRICLVYDCLYPHTVGGAERWLRALGERLAREGHDVTYLTLRQWDRGTDPRVPRVRVVPVGPRMELYVRGRRRVAPPLVFGLGVFWHLLRHGRRYDVVHTVSFPYFALLAAAALRPLGRYGLAVDWLEIWSRDYWREYLGRAGGAVGLAVQRLCVRVPQRAFCFSRLHAQRLRAEGLRSEPVMLAGIYDGPAGEPDLRPARPEVIFAGRHIPEKRAAAIVPAVVEAARSIPGLRATVFGDGPQRPDVLAAIEQLGAAAIVSAPGFVDGDVVDEALAHALCMVLPSRREGYGLVVIESAARGTPSVVVREEDNAAVELVQDGVNGVIAASAAPHDLAAAILRVHEAGDDLRRSTAAWFARNATRLSVSSSLDAVVSVYASARR
jgi:glycosyltransferase involved in cell wall biosynthesis